MNLNGIGKVVSISKIDPFLEEKNNYFSKEFTKRQLLQIPYGTIIWAKRYKNAQEKEFINVGHTEGPFVVVGRTTKGLYCLYATSKQQISENSSIRLRMENYSGYLKKDTYIKMGSPCLIRKKMFVEIFGKLNNDDLRKLDKIIRINKNQKAFNINFEENVLPLEAGDIVVLNGKRFLILDDIKGYTLLPIFSQKNTSKIEVNGVEYYYDSNDAFSIENIDNAKLVDFIDSYELDKIKAKRKSYLKYLNEKDKINRGSLLQREESFYYVYGENGAVWLAFEVSITADDQLAKITIKDKDYFSDFSDNIEISKKDENYTVVDLALPTEIEEIKKQKKSYLKSNTSKKPKEKRYGIDTGDIVTSRLKDNSTYIVVVGNQDDIVVVDKSCTLNGDYRLSTLSLWESCKIGKTDNNTIRMILEKVKNSTYGWINAERINKLMKKYDK